MFTPDIINDKLHYYRNSLMGEAPSRSAGSVQIDSFQRCAEQTDSSCVDVLWGSALLSSLRSLPSNIQSVPATKELILFHSSGHIFRLPPSSVSTEEDRGVSMVNQLLIDCRDWPTSVQREAEAGQTSCRCVSVDTGCLTEPNIGFSSSCHPLPCDFFLILLCSVGLRPSPSPAVFLGHCQFFCCSRGHQSQPLQCFSARQLGGAASAAAPLQLLKEPPLPERSPHCSPVAPFLPPCPSPVHPQSCRGF